MFFIPILDLSGIGKSGVFLFFLLSSFLLTLILLPQGKEILSYSVMSHYWQRRFFRIYPLYTLYLLFAVMSTWFFTTAMGRSGVGIPFDLNWHGFLNHLFLLEGKDVTWSIAVEFKFYFLLPFLVLTIVVIRSFGDGATLLYFFLLMLLSQVISPQSESLTNDTRLLPYLPIFLVGVFLAVLQDGINRNGLHKIARETLRYLGFLGVFGVVLMTPLVCSLLGQSVPYNYFHKQFILYSICWSLILLSAVNVSGVIQRFFALPLLMFYGALSFSLYLFHPIFIRFVTAFGVAESFSAWFVLLASTATAYISFKVLEDPVSKYSLRT